jgi:hypothetical protein
MSPIPCQEIIARLRAMTKQDLGNDSQAWIDHYRNHP